MAVKKIKREDTDKFLDEVLNSNITVENFQEIAAKSLETAEFERVNKILLDHYNKENKIDFQTQLKAIIGNDVIEKIKNREDIEIEEENQIDEQARDIEGVDEKTIEEAKKNTKQEKEKNKDENKEFDLRAELMKQVYKEVYKKYSDTLYDLKRRQIGRDELTVGDKEGTELVLYENYLKRLERNYNGYANIHNLDEKILSDNKDIMEAKKDLARNIGRDEDLSKQRIEKNIHAIDKLYEERKVIAEKIEELSRNEKYDEDAMKEYQKEYRKLTYRIRDIQPSLEEYARQIEMEQKNIDLAKEYGLPGDNEIVAGNIVKDDITRDDLEDIEGSVEEKVEKVQGDEEYDKAKHLYNLSKDIRVQINEGRYEEAEKQLEQAETELEIEDTEEKEAEDKEQKLSNEEVDEKLDNENEKNREDMSSKGKIINDLDERKDWSNKTLTDDDISKKDKLLERLNRVEDKIDEKYPNWNDNLKEQEVVKQL